MKEEIKPFAGICPNCSADLEEDCDCNFADWYNSKD